ncbi:MAG: hypothetical protein H7Y04_04630 [Verrucomicrobia bacterium]|nr:hypothetical protein [Cytophagales bacterium]
MRFGIILLIICLTGVYAYSQGLKINVDKKVVDSHEASLYDKSGISKISLTKDESYLVATTYSNYTKIWDMRSLKVHANFKTQGIKNRLVRIALHPSRNIIAIPSKGGKSIKIFEIENKKKLLELKFIFPITHLCFSQDGEKLISYHANHHFYIWDLNKGTIISDIALADKNGISAGIFSNSDNSFTVLIENRLKPQNFIQLKLAKYSLDNFQIQNYNYSIPPCHSMTTSLGGKLLCLYGIGK